MSPSRTLSDTLAIELRHLVHDAGRVTLVESGITAARARADGVLLVPAMRTAESVALHLLGATGVDPVAFKTRLQFTHARTTNVTRTGVLAMEQLR